jgi:hypothetical protein
MRRCEFITLIDGATASRPCAPRGTCVRQAVSRARKTRARPHDSALRGRAGTRQHCFDYSETLRVTGIPANLDIVDCVSVKPCRFGRRAACVTSRLVRNLHHLGRAQGAVGLPLAARRAIFCVLPLTREGCRYFRGGDGSGVPSAGMILHQTDLAFLPVNHPHRLCADMCMGGN